MYYRCVFHGGIGISTYLKPAGSKGSQNRVGCCTVLPNVSAYVCLRPRDCNINSDQNKRISGSNKSMRCCWPACSLTGVKSLTDSKILFDVSCYQNENRIADYTAYKSAALIVWG